MLHLTLKYGHETDSTQVASGKDERHFVKRLKRGREIVANEADGKEDAVETMNWGFGVFAMSKSQVSH